MNWQLAAVLEALASAGYYTRIVYVKSQTRVHVRRCRWWKCKAEYVCGYLVLGDKIDYSKLHKDQVKIYQIVEKGLGR